MSKFVWQQAVDAAIARVGSREAVAKKLGITRQATHEWGEKLPAKHVLALEAMSGVSRYELRPDIYGDPPERSRRGNGGKRHPKASVPRHELTAA